MMKSFILVFALLLLLPGQISAADSPNFIFPVACSLGEDCWTVHYVDVDADEKAQDFKCGSKTYNDHKGTDFAVRSLADVERGVPVLAAKSGKVARVRDGETDTIKEEDDLQAIKDARKECGNAVFLNHSDGLYTLYCHLKKDSVSVAVDDEVTAGQKIGEVGHSGLTEFPHLHFGVVWEGGVVDPFTGLLNTEGCGKTKGSLWAPGQGLDYEPLVLYDAGFRAAVPDFESVKRGEDHPDELPAESKALVFWAGFYGIEQGDEMRLTVTDPNGRTFVDRTITQDKTRARQYYYTGRKRENGLTPGTYVGMVTIKRGDIQKSRTEQITVR